MDLRRIVVFSSVCLWVAACGSSGPINPAKDVLSADVPTSDVRFDTLDVRLDTPAPDAADPGQTDTGGTELSVDSGAGGDIPVSDIPQPEDSAVPDVATPCQVGSLIVTEILSNPLVTSDTMGEYFEVYNTTDNAIPLAGWSLTSGKDKYTFPVTATASVPARSHFLMAAAEKGNGGLTPDYVYDKISLGNASDELVLVCPDGVEVDRVAWVGKLGWPKKEGHAMTLDPSAYDPTMNEEFKYWCNAPTQWVTNGDFGSPGKLNESCKPSSCGDKVAQFWEECDDGNIKKDDGCEPDCTTSPDQDGDGVPDAIDNCLKDPNPDQLDSDKDKVGDVCDSPNCGNKVIEPPEECDDGNKTQGDGCENNCTNSIDSDDDGIFDAKDNCKLVKNPGQEDADKDGIGDACDEPDCGNNVPEGLEECDDGNTVSGDGCSATCWVENYEPGSIIITEFLYNPKGTNETTGEWVEIYNTTDIDIDIAGWVLDDEATEHAKLLPESGVLIVPAKGYRILGKSDDMELNGGVTVDFAYGSKFSMNTPVDKIVLLWNGQVIDKVLYTIPAVFPAATGASLQLTASCVDATCNDAGANWCVSKDSALPDGDFGSPGAANAECAAQ